MHTQVLFEHPLNEKMRTWLRIEFLIQHEDAKTVEFIVDKMVTLWGDDASWLLDGENHPHEAHYLKLDCS
ncbi:hypothetical protein ONQ60_27465, partial [Salmonella enterica subsp. enterica serovar Virginia]|nr:hypothetical protein [Salmonella enterica subsp. enterica serovar Virginia]